VPRHQERHRGDIEVVAYTPLNGTAAGGTLPDLTVTADGCPVGPTLVGALDVFVASATAAPEPVAESWGRVKARYAR